MKMAETVLPLFVCLLYVLMSTFVQGSSDQSERKAYIVYMGDVPTGAELSAVDQHHNLLLAATRDASIARKARIYSYSRSFNGFAARLLPHEAKLLSDQERVVSVFPNTVNKLHTTRSWDFLRLTKTAKRKPLRESNIIVGVFDTGIYVNSPSFNDAGFSPAPARWRGKCLTGANFSGCNNKVIGAKYYDLEGAALEPRSPSDNDGHGTHTSSTAAGVSVRGASLYGIGRGTARGGVPSARIAMYKVCWRGGCTDMDMLAAFDDAIADGVDIISISIGGAGRPYFQDPIAIGSFHAMRKGILVSCSAGNDGPDPYTVQNVAPWIMTVAATSTDRQFMTPIMMGNGKRTAGVSINTFTPKRMMYPLINGAQATNRTGDYYGNVSACDYGLLSMDKVKGKIVYCLGLGTQDWTIKELKGAGVIISTESAIDIASITMIPGSYVLIKDGLQIDRYINTTKNPKAIIYKTRTVHMSAPFVASFSSRGPQSINRNILKPDIAAPGLNILAAYSRLTTVTGMPEDNRISTFNILSGTSMACPHAAAAAAYIKSFHPKWSPAAIKSALMTTATPMKIKDPSKEFGSGSGQINPRKAVDPGLIYDITMESYLSFLCKEGYNSTLIALLTGNKNYNCSNFKPAVGTDGLNYPTMHMQLQTVACAVSAEFYRTVTHVGKKASVYKATVTSPKGLTITVSPETLSFSRPNEQKSFKVSVRGERTSNASFISALLEWNDGKHSVRSPILLYKPQGY